MSNVETLETTLLRYCGDTEDETEDVLTDDECLGVGVAICPKCSHHQFVTQHDYYRDIGVYMAGMVWCHECMIWTHAREWVRG